MPRIIVTCKFSVVRVKNETPAFEKANNGKMIKATHGCSLCCKVFKSESCAFFLFCNGIVKANITPAKVAWIPDFNRQTHRTTPTVRYIERYVTPFLFKINKMKVQKEA